MTTLLAYLHVFVGNIAKHNGLSLSLQGGGGPVYNNVFVNRPILYVLEGGNG